jgi:hypothetical protein
MCAEARRWVAVDRTGAPGNRHRLFGLVGGGVSSSDALPIQKNELPSNGCAERRLPW